MRVLAPQVAQERKKSLLQWIIHRYINTSKPVSSQAVAEEGAFKLSSATIRNVLKELEDEGFLLQPHASSGRIPTDKGYRFFVDSLMDVQRLAADEKDRIQRQYQSQVEELDHLLAQTSKMLSHMSHSAGFVLSPRAEEHTLKRLEVLPIGNRHILVILLTHSGLIRHWSIPLSFEPSPQRLAVLNRFLNDNAQGKAIRDVRAALLGRIEAAEREFKELSALARDILGEVASFASPESLYVDGASNVLSLAEPGDMEGARGLIRVLEEKRRFAGLLQRQLEESSRLPSARPGKVSVRIGNENTLPELKGLSLVATTYEIKDHAVGMLGIVGPKRMEYSKMVALVDFVSTVVSRTLSKWEGMWDEDEHGKRPR